MLWTSSSLPWKDYFELMFCMCNITISGMYLTVLPTIFECQKHMRLHSIEWITITCERDKIHSVNIRAVGAVFQHVFHMCMSQNVSMQTKIWSWIFMASWSRSIILHTYTEVHFFATVNMDIISVLILSSPLLLNSFLTALCFLVSTNLQFELGH